MHSKKNKKKNSQAKKSTYAGLIQDFDAQKTNYTNFKAYIGFTDPFFKKLCKSSMVFLAEEKDCIFFWELFKEDTKIHYKKKAGKIKKPRAQMSTGSESDC